MWNRFIFENTVHFSFELFLTIAIAIMGLLIFQKTKEFADLSGKQSIKLFRYAFLFFSITFLVRFILFSFMATSFFLNFDKTIRHILNLSLVPLIVFFSFTAIMLLASSLLKSLRERKNIILNISLISLVISLISLFFISIFILFIIELVMILFAITILIVQNRKQKKKNKFLKVYFLLFLFWLFNIGTLIPLRIRIPLEIIIIPQIISTIIFIFIFLKILKKTK